MLGFVIAALAGYLAPRAEDPLARPVARAIAPHIRVEPGEMRLLAFMLVLLIAGLLSDLFESGSAFWVVLGGVLGYFAARIVPALRRLSGIDR